MPFKLINIHLIPPNFQLGSLLSDESFICWLKDEAEPSQKRKWDEWLESDVSQHELVKKAKVLLEMPFNKTEPSDMKQELYHLRRSITGSETGKNQQKPDH